jgi:hypothetical protein
MRFHALRPALGKDPNEELLDEGQCHGDAFRASRFFVYDPQNPGDALL